MDLTELEPQFMRRVVTPNVPTRISGPDGVIREELRESVGYRHVDTLAEADGIDFLCPTCFVANKGSVGTHHILCWRPGRVPLDATPGPGRWDFEGTGYADLTLTAQPPSILLRSGCNAHFHVRSGKVTFA